MKSISKNFSKQVVLTLCSLFVMVSSIEARCKSGKCPNKQRTHKERGCVTGRCGK